MWMCAWGVSGVRAACCCLQDKCGVKTREQAVKNIRKCGDTGHEVCARAHACVCVCVSALACVSEANFSSSSDGSHLAFLKKILLFKFLLKFCTVFFFYHSSPPQTPPRSSLSPYPFKLMSIHLSHLSNMTSQKLWQHAQDLHRFKPDKAPSTEKKKWT